MAVEQVLAVIAATVAPNTAVISPADVAVTPLVQNIVVPGYDFVMQQRFFGANTKVATWTVNTQQTFDFQGRPNDAKADNND
jgi:hypothetical protein